LSAIKLIKSHQNKLRGEGIRWKKNWSKNKVFVSPLGRKIKVKNLYRKRALRTWAWSYQQKFSDLRNFQKTLNLPFLSEGSEKLAS
jgi:hypothetical protein